MAGLGCPTLPALGHMGLVLPRRFHKDYATGRLDEWASRESNPCGPQMPEGKVLNSRTSLAHQHALGGFNSRSAPEPESARAALPGTVPRRGTGLGKLAPTRTPRESHRRRSRHRSSRVPSSSPSRRSGRVDDEITHDADAGRTPHCWRRQGPNRLERG